MKQASLPGKTQILNDLNQSQPKRPSEVITKYDVQPVFLEELDKSSLEVESLDSIEETSSSSMLSSLLEESGEESMSEHSSEKMNESSKQPNAEGIKIDISESPLCKMGTQITPSPNKKLADSK
jgi:hypothetical protein